MSSVLQATDLVKSFGDAPVLGGLNLDVPEGSVYGLVGPNGAGKTTTIKIAMNILQPADFLLAFPREDDDRSDRGAVGSGVSCGVDTESARGDDRGQRAVRRDMRIDEFRLTEFAFSASVRR